MGRHGFRVRGNIVLKEYRSKNSYAREKKALKSLQPHPFITELLQSCETKIFGKFLGILEFKYYKGCDLHTWIDAHPHGSETRFIRYAMKKVLLAYDYARKISIFHRDIKPENIMIDEHGIVKLIDWELCSFTKYSHKKVGTQEYMAEEVLREEPYECEKSDIWSLGVLFFSLATGQRPYGSFSSNYTYSVLGRNSDEWIKAIYNYRWTRFWKSHELKFTLEIPCQLKNCVEKMLQKDPDRRLNIEGTMFHSFFIGDECRPEEVVEEMLVSVVNNPLT